MIDIYENSKPNGNQNKINFESISLYLFIGFINLFHFLCMWVCIVCIVCEDMYVLRKKS